MWIQINKHTINLEQVAYIEKIQHGYTIVLNNGHEIKTFDKNDENIIRRAIEFLTHRGLSRELT